MSFRRNKDPSKRKIEEDDKIVLRRSKRLKTTPEEVIDSFKREDFQNDLSRNQAVSEDIQFNSVSREVEVRNFISFYLIIFISA